MKRLKNKLKRNGGHFSWQQRSFLEGEQISIVLERVNFLM